ncbi:unnamed protein product [Paramecium sonneborni]|uniref:PSI domain-containing protein n=1 Tax=Paramecium sonneborni TaxID=65129 RepID=A0A8S1ML60_9CILI|nr:unnamed protein product [Paramecium sonneborni]
MKFVLLLLYSISFSGVQSERVDVKNKCICSKIQTIEECNIDCEWNYVEGTCRDSNLPLLRTSYCKYQNDNCNKKIGCANYQGICVPFTGCTAIKQNTNFECQKYSQLCITDGSKCVEKSICANYKTRFSCRNNYINYEWKGFCYWDKQECRNAQSCNELSFSLKNDAECRSQLSWCTFKQGGGCEDSGEQCKDHKLEQQCVTNKKGNINCYWDGKQCNDFICKYITKDCIKNGCSIDQDSKCIDRLECNDYKVEKSCTYNKNNIQCMWENNTCSIKSCENASTTRQTNQQCQEIDPQCITKFGGGCKLNGECEAANNKAGCSFNKRGDFCYWNGYQCVLKQCQWAPAAFKNKDQCKNFQSDCVYNNQTQQCIKEGCYAQQNQTTCTQSKECNWQNKCDIKTCETAGKNIKYISHEDCWNYLSNCTLNDSGIGCMMIKYSCNEYDRQVQCYQSLQSKCTWHQNQCMNSQCEYLNYKTHFECNNYLQNCTTDGNKCIQLKSTCKQYTLEQSCNITSSKFPCFWSKNECQDITCNLVEKTYKFNTHQECNSYQSQCTVLDRITGCIITPNDCGLLNQDQCFGSKCIFSNGICRDKQCKDYKGDITQSNCEAYITGKKCMRGPGLIPNSCIDRVNNCKDIKNEFQCEDAKDINNQKCRWVFLNCIDWSKNLKRKETNCQDGWTSYENDTTLCVRDKKCDDQGIATNVGYTNEICEDYFVMCMKDTDNACKLKTTIQSNGCPFYVSKINCISQTNCYWTNDNFCKVITTECSSLNTQDCSGNKDISGTFCKWNDVSNQCEDICASLVPVGQKCSSLDSKCVIKFGSPDKCIKLKASCTDYIVSQIECEDDSRCVYKDDKCLEKQCSDITENFTHAQCNSYKLECTVAYPGGCTNLLPNCTDYKSQIQCNINDKSKKCFWTESKGCIEKKCSEIIFDPNEQKTQCLSFYTDLTCNINNSENGCEDLRISCDKYKKENQCYKQLDQYECLWEEEKCQKAECYNIVLDNYSHSECYGKYSKLQCTINDTKNGCMEMKTNCRKYLIEEQCIKTFNNEDCVWNQLYQECNYKTCKDEIEENVKCSDYHPTCIDIQYPCREKVCEDYQFYNDEDCRRYNPKCTSNGRFCIQRGTCEQNQYEQACNIDINNRYCGWNSGKNQCNYLQCSDAPNELIYSQDCEKYFPNQNCVTKYGGGCLIITSCSDYTIQGQCDESKLFQCIWENEICRQKVCTDFKSGNILECQSKQLNCITDGNTCIEMRYCSQLSQQNCFIGIEGNCLFLNGRCQAYQNCQSIQLKTHLECYDNLQNQCTSNGTHCISITACDEYIDKISCIKGIDGDCAWQNSKCSKFTSCDNYLFKTHQECNSINQSCTTNGLNQCIVLQECSKYIIQENCQLNVNGIIKKNGLIIQLATCLWIDGQCINPRCEDLYGTDHLKCYQQLSSCTTNGIKCIKMETTCSNYPMDICGSTFSQQGKCFVNNSSCTLFDCSSVLTDTQCKNLSHCQFINKQCQLFQQCQNYITEKECTIGTDGQCLFKNSKCLLMKSCTDTNLQEYCDPKRCYYNSTSKSCQEFICENYGLQNPCRPFYDYSKTILTYCVFDYKNSKCTETTPNKYNVTDCYTKSLGYFINQNNICKSCYFNPLNPLPPDSNINKTNNTNNTNNTNDTVDIYGFISNIILIGLLIIN